MKKIICLCLSVFIVSFCFAKELIIPYNQNEKIGFVNEKMQIITYPEYDSVFLQSKYYVWAVKKNSDKLVIESAIIFSDGRKRELELVKEKVCSIGDDYYAINQSGAEGISKIYKVNNNEEVLSLKGCQFLNSKSEKRILIENPYDKSKSRNFYIDLKGNEYLQNNTNLKILSDNYDSQTLFFETKNNDVILTDFSGKMLIQYYFSSMDVGRVGNGLFLGYIKDKGDGYFNTKGELKIPVQVKNEQNYNLLPVFNTDVIPCCIEDGIITLQESFVQRNSDNWAIINSKGKVIVKNITADYISEFSNDGVAILYKNTDLGLKYSLINNKGKIITDQEFDYIDESVNGFARARKKNIDYLISVDSGKYYRIFEILIKSKKE